MLRGSRVVGEGRRLVHVGYVNRYRNGVVAGRVGVHGLRVCALRLGRRRDRYRYVVGNLVFVVQVGSRLDGNLPGVAANLKLAGIRSAQGVGVGVGGIGGLGRYRRAYVGSRRRVFGDVAGYAAGLGDSVAGVRPVPLPSAFTALTCTS